MAGHQSTRITSHADVDLRKARPPSVGRGRISLAPVSSRDKGRELNVIPFKFLIADSRSK